MKIVIVLGAAAALYACSEAKAPEPETPVAAAETPAAMPAAAEHLAGKYEYTDGDFTGPYETRPDGTYSAATPEGEIKGTWTQDGDKTCFDPEGEGGNLDQECWTRSASNADGSFTAVSAKDGRTVTVRVPAGS